MVCVGYDDEKQHFIVLNSWGVEFGDKGYCYFPYDFISDNNLCNDCHAFLDVELKLFGEDDDCPPEDIFGCISPRNLINACKTI